MTHSRGLHAFVFSLCFSFAALSARAATTDFRIFLDVDRDVATGCTVSGMAGVDQVFLTRVETTATGGSVTRTARQLCTGGVLGAESVVDSTGWPAGFQTESGNLLVETRMAAADIGSPLPSLMRIGVEALQGSAVHSATTRPDGSPVLFPEMPRGRRRASSPAGPARVITMDGDGADWLPLGALIDGVASGGSSGLRLVKFFAFVGGDGFVYFRFDANLSTDSPVALDDTFPRPAGAGVTVPPPGVLLNDLNPSSTPLTATPVSQPEHGDLTLNPDGGFTYTPDTPGSTQTDSFEYKASNGKDSNRARVQIPVGAVVNTAPIFVSTATPTVAEGTTTVLSLVAADMDGDTVTYAITGGADQARFAITGGNTLVFNAAPDFEVPLSTLGTNVYVVQVTADDGHGHSTNQLLSVTVTNVDEAPFFTPPFSFSTAENTTSVGTVGASDPDGTTLTYSISGGDAARFNIHGTTGLLTFSAAPDFEAPVDGGSNNVYTFQVTATDLGGNTAVQTVNVTVTDENEAPLFTSTSSPNVPENTTAVLTVTASDPEGNALTYSISGGADQGRFSINATTGALVFTAPQNFEAPGDADANGVYQVEITVTDGANPVTQTLAVVLTNVNEAPVVTSANAANVAENSTAVLTVTATDQESATIAYTITGGADAARFVLHATTGALTFSTAPNFELPTDAGANNQYELTITASDGVNTVTQTITVTVTNVDEAPTFTSTAAPSVPENTTAVVTVAASDPEAQAVTYTLTGGADQALFAINAATGALTFTSARNFEAPADADTNNVYLVQVTANDGTNNAVQNLAVTVTNVNEAPAITSANNATVPENTVVATTVTTTDQEANTIAYSITGGADAARFSIGAATGVLSFDAAPNYEAPTDADTNNQYVVQVTATDGTTPVSQTITVTVTDVNEAPVVTSAAAVSVAEGTTTVLTVTSSDEEGNAITYALSGGADQARFSINATTGALTFNVVPNFEAPLDADANNIYIVTVTANDGTNATPQTITVTVTDANEAPVATDATFSINENSANGTAVGTVSASDPDAGQSLSYAITAGNTGGAFAINATTGAITVADVADVDFELNPSFTLTVTVTDNGTGTLTDTAAITINVTNLNEAPVVDAATVSLTENSANGAAVHTVTFTDPDNTAQTHTFAITGGNALGAFAINTTTGAITVADTTDINFEANPTFTLTVEVTDAGAPTPSLSGSATITINLTDVNEAPTFTSLSTQSVAENTTAVVVVATSDPEGNSVTYSITGGADQALFSIDSSTGALSFLSGRNYEAPTDAGGDNVYDVQVTATDGTNNVVQNIAVSVTDSNEAPSFTSIANPSVPENGVTAVTVATSDPEGQTVTYSISGGADSAAFAINSTTGVLTFNTAPNYEAPTDTGADNTYVVEVAATDGTNPVTQTITVTVDDVNEAPSFTSNASRSVAENTTAIGAVTATDPEGNGLTYSITGGADQALFSIDGATGALSFGSGRNYEAPTDANSDNDYIVQVTVTDGTTPVAQTITVSVTDANEAPSITSLDVFSVPENTTAVTTVTTSDPEGDSITYSVSGGADAASFAIGATSGALTFSPAPNFEAPADAGANNEYIVQVTATDGTSSVNQTITVTVTAVDEQPVFSSTASPSVPENTTAVVTVQATDPEGGTPTYSITGGADQAKFAIDGTTGALTFLIAPDYEAPTDANTDNTYIVQVTASDSNPGVQTITVTVNDANDPPSFTSSANPSVPENSTAVITVVATDPELGAVTYSISGGADAALFAIGTTTGALTFNTAPNYEAPTDTGANNVYDVQVTATDGTNSAVQNIAVDVDDVNEAPSITSDDSFSVAENMTAVTTVTSTDPENNTITYSISGGDDQAAFSINATSGVLSFSVAPNHEAPADDDGNNVYLVQVTATDGTTPVNQTITVTVTGVDEGPSFSSNATRNVPENTTAVGNVVAVDPEGTAVTYSFTGGADQAKFSLNTTTGALAFLVAPNYEAPTDTDNNNSYLVQVTATDGSNPVVQNLTVIVDNVNEAPSFTSSASQSVVENSTAVTTVAATDPDGTTPTYSITGGADGSKFSINGTSGALSFSVAPNYEAATDNNTDNQYLVEVTATDGVNSVVQSLTVEVTNLDEAPLFATANTASVAENTTAVVTVSATDPEGAAVTYSITGGADLGDFSINGTSGALTFNPAPNFEAPADADTNNSYVVQVTATDGANPVNLTITVTVTNVNEAPSNTVPGAQTFDEDVNRVFSAANGNQISVSDPDGDVNVRVTLTATNGSLTLSGVAGLSFNPATCTGTAGDGTNDTAMTFCGSVTSVNNALNGLTYDPNEHYNGSAAVTILTNDQGNSGSGGALSSNGGVADSIALTITAVNDPPLIGTSGVIDRTATTIMPNMTYSVAAILGSVTDPDDADPGFDPVFTLTAASCTGCTVTNLNGAAGTFDIEPPAGFTGTLEIDVTVQDNGRPGTASTNGKVKYTVGGEIIWFVNPVLGLPANTGTMSKPVQKIGDLTGRTANDSIFVYSGSHAGAVTLLASETLIGQGTTDTFDGAFGIAPPAGTAARPNTKANDGALTNPVFQSSLTAASSTVVRNIAIASTGAGYIASGATNLTVLDSSVSAAGKAVDLTNSTASGIGVHFTSTSSSAGSHGISLQGVNGSFAFGGGSLNGNTTAAFFLKDSQASTITYSGSLAPTGGRAVLIGTPDNTGNASNGMEAGTTVTLSGSITAGGVAVYESTGGTLFLTGANHTWSTGGTAGVELIDNFSSVTGTGATINFHGGNLNITTSSGTGFHASEGGTVNVTGTDNVINVTANGIGLDIVGTSTEVMGGSHTWEKISVSGGSVADYGIRVTHASGSYAVTGDDNNDGNPDSLTAGGTIQNIEKRGAEFSNVAGAVSLNGMTFTNAATTNGAAVSICGLPITGDTTQCNAAIHLVNATTSVGLRSIFVNGSEQQGINANNVTNLNITNVEVTGAGDETDESGVMLTNIKGTGSITNSNFHDNHTRAMHLANKAGTLSSFPIKGTTFNGTVIAQGLLVELHNAGTVANVAVGGAGGDACTFSDTVGNGFEAAASSNANLTFSVNGSTITNTNGVVGANAAVGGVVNTTLTNNSFIAGANTTAGVISLASSNGGVMTADVVSNTIGSATAGSGTACTGCNGFFINPHSTGVSDVKIRGNTIQNVNGSGIYYAAGNVGGSYNHKLTVTGNVIRDPGPNATTSSPALQIRNGLTSGTDGVTGTPDDDAGCVAVTFGGATSSGGASTAADAKNIFEDSWNGAGADIFLFTRFATTTKFPGYGGSFDAYVRANNVVPASPTQTVSTLHQNSSTAAAGTACP